MQGNTVFNVGSIQLNTTTGKDYIQTMVQGAEVYQLTSKAGGQVSLIAFDNSVAAKRFFAEKRDYFFSKIN